MRHHFRMFLGVFGLLCLASTFALADAKVETQTFGPEGDSIGGSISPEGKHVAVLAAKGSKFTVFYDGVAGSKIDQVPTGTGSIFTSASAVWIGQVPILFCNDGTHWTYSFKSGDDCVIMLDGK